MLNNDEAKTFYFFTDAYAIGLCSVMGGGEVTFKRNKPAARREMVPDAASLYVHLSKKEYRPLLFVFSSRVRPRLPPAKQGYHLP